VAQYQDLICSTGDHGKCLHGYCYAPGPAIGSKRGISSDGMPEWSHGILRHDFFCDRQISSMGEDLFEAMSVDIEE
jgi:hypothetical protein